MFSTIYESQQGKWHTNLLPGIFWDVSRFFKHRLQNKSHPFGGEVSHCGLAGKAASEYGINDSMKHEDALDQETRHLCFV